MKKNRAGTYTASNVSFDPNTCTAFSYSWWKFVARIDDKVVFNPYRYSKTTCGHQAKVRRLMDSLDIKIDLELECPKGLQDLRSSLAHYQEKLSELNLASYSGRIKESTIQKRKEEIKDCESKIKVLNKLISMEK